MLAGWHGHPENGRTGQHGWWSRQRGGRVVRSEWHLEAVEPRTGGNSRQEPVGSGRCAARSWQNAGRKRVGRQFCNQQTLLVTQGQGCAVGRQCGKCVASGPSVAKFGCTQCPGYERGEVCGVGRCGRVSSAPVRGRVCARAGRMPEPHSTHPGRQGRQPTKPTQECSSRQEDKEGMVPAVCIACHGWWRVGCGGRWCGGGHACGPWGNPGTGVFVCGCVRPHAKVQAKCVQGQGLSRPGRGRAGVGGEGQVPAGEGTCRQVWCCQGGGRRGGTVRKAAAGVRQWGRQMACLGSCEPVMCPRFIRVQPYE